MKLVSLLNNCIKTSKFVKQLYKKVLSLLNSCIEKLVSLLNCCMKLVSRSTKFVELLYEN